MQFVELKMHVLTPIRLAVLVGPFPALCKMVTVFLSRLPVDSSRRPSSSTAAPFFNSETP